MSHTTMIIEQETSQYVDGRSGQVPSTSKKVNAAPLRLDAVNLGQFVGDVAK